MNALLGCDVTPPSDRVDAEQFHRYLDEKVPGVQSTTAGAPLPSFQRSSTDVSFNYFQAVSLNEMMAAVKALQDKSCTVDPCRPNWLLKAAVNVISTFFT
jgi:hypothetical protein